MAQDTYTHDEPRVNVGAIDHVDHGRTTLAAAITKILAERCLDLSANKFTPSDQMDNAPEKRQRGITINVSHVEYEAPSHHYAHADAPRRADYIRSMTTGATRMNGAIFMIAATDGPMVQTKEHVLLAKQVGVPSTLVALNRCDSPDVDKDMLEIVEDKIRDDLEKQDFNHDYPIVRVSALRVLEGNPEWTRKAEELMDAVDTYIPTPECDLDKPFLMFIEGIFTITGRGTVVTGRVGCGKLPLNSKVEIVGICDTQKTTVTGTEMFHKFMDEAYIGENCGLLLRDTKCGDVEHGQAMCAPGSVTPHTKFEGKVYILKKKEGECHKSSCDGYRSRFFFRTANVTGVIKLLKGTETVMLGGATEISVEPVQSIAMEKGSGFTIREGGHTVGSGKITKTIG